jgi:5-methylcytosine-specific restriction protein A
MEFVRGNLALRDHLKNDKHVFLFEYRSKGIVEFISELEFLDCDYFMSHDTNNQDRIAIKFFLKRKGAVLNYDLKKIPEGAEDTEQAFRKPNPTEREGIVLSRVGQGAYRKSIINIWENRCAITEFDNPKILIASHIVPWRDANDVERLDVHNGILLSPTYDALFDRHLISFDEHGKILLSKEIKNSSGHKIGLTGKESLAKSHDGLQEYLERHREVFALKN